MEKKSDPDLSRPVKLHFHESNGPVDEAIDHLLELAGGVHQSGYIREMIIAALKAGQEDMDMAGLRLMNTTLKEMRFTAKIFGPYRHVKKVTVFGSARTRPEEAAYKTAVEIGQKLKENGYMVITGGGPGIMQAVNEGAGADYSFGINIRLPFEQKSNPVVEGNPRSITYKYFFNRKVAFIKEAHAVVLFPGGFGTLDEAMETLTLVQTGKRDPIPLILLDPPGSTYWLRWLRFLKAELMLHGYINPDDFHLFERVDSVGEAVARIALFYRRYHSLRYVGERLIIRMQSGIPPESLANIRTAFAGLLVPGGDIRPVEALPEEAGESPEVLALPRLQVDFNRKHFGLLRHLIDAINEA